MAPKHLTERLRGIRRPAIEAAPDGVLLRIDRDWLARRAVFDRQREANRKMQISSDPSELARCRKVITDTPRLLVALSQAFNPAGARVGDVPDASGARD
ncbi:MAG: hypothetical protein J2P48_24880, partial [Alphaproteobacteria bacterium]|nr:hypothetical protein [Alphaproteobacteria bacterium]